MANFNKMLKQMQQLQQELMKKQDEVKTLEVTGESAGGLVKVTANCAMEIKRIDIDDEIWKENDKDMLADLVAAAVNMALSSAQEKMNDELSGLTGGMNIPGM